MKLLLSLLAVTTVAAQAASFEVTDSWFRKLPGTLPAAGYFTARNNTSHDIAINGAESGVCGMLMMHHSSNKGGMSSMDMVDKVTVPAGGSVSFAPGGYHLMCEAPKMTIGGKAPVNLSLSDGSSVVVAFAVRGPSGK